MKSQHAAAPGALELRPHAGNAVLVMAASAAFVVIGWFMAHDPEADVVTRSIAWFGIVFFGLGIPVGLRKLLSRGPQLILCDAGIDDRTNRLGLIPWGEIVGAELRDIHGQKFVMLEMSDPQAWEAKVPDWSRWTFKVSRMLKIHGIPVHVSGLTMGSTDVVAEIQRRLVQHGLR